MAPSAGIEPALQPPQSCVLSTTLRGHTRILNLPLSEAQKQERGEWPFQPPSPFGKT